MEILCIFAVQYFCRSYEPRVKSQKCDIDSSFQRIEYEIACRVHIRRGGHRFETKKKLKKIYRGIEQYASATLSTGFARRAHIRRGGHRFETKKKLKKIHRGIEQYASATLSTGFARRAHIRRGGHRFETKKKLKKIYRGIEQ